MALRAYQAYKDGTILCRPDKAFTPPSGKALAVT